MSAFEIRSNKGSTLRGDLSKESLAIFMRVSEKITENSEWLGQQAPPEIYLPYTLSGLERPVYLVSRIPWVVLSAEPLGHWWGICVLEERKKIYKSKKRKLETAEGISRSTYTKVDRHSFEIRNWTAQGSKAIRRLNGICWSEVTTRNRKNIYNSIIN